MVLGIPRNSYRSLARRLAELFQRSKTPSLDDSRALLAPPDKKPKNDYNVPYRFIPGCGLIVYPTPSSRKRDPY